MAAKNELVAVTDFTLTLPDKQEIMEIMQENMEGVDLKFERVKIPSGGGLAWEVPNEDGEADTTKEIIGVIIDHHPVNAYWKEEYSGESNPPDCSALDALIGEGTPGGKCAICPLNQFGSDPKGGRGKACKNMRRIYVLREGEVFPLLITLPPTSLSNFKEYARRLTNRLRRLTGVLTKITLTKEKSDGGILFSVAVFARTGDLPKEQAAKIAAHAAVLKPYLRKISLTDDDYIVPEEETSTQTEEFAGQTIDMPDSSGQAAGGKW